MKAATRGGSTMLALPTLDAAPGHLSVPQHGPQVGAWHQPAAG